MNIPPPDQEAIAKEWAKRHPGFIREDSDLLKKKEIVIMKPKTTVMTKRYVCAYCKKEFAYKGAYRKHLTSCTAKIGKDSIEPVVKDNATKLQPSENLLKAISEDTAKPYEPQIGAPWPGSPRPKAATTTPAPEAPNAYAPSTAYNYAQTFGTPAKITAPAVSRKVDAVYYLLVAILSTILLCGLIAAAMGIKLLAGL
jgi:hypothetical protein